MGNMSGRPRFDRTHILDKLLCRVYPHPEASHRAGLFGSMFPVRFTTDSVSKLNVKLLQTH